MWTGSWTGVPDNPSVVSAISAMIRFIRAASPQGARGRTSHNPSAVGSSPTRPTCGYTFHLRWRVDVSWTEASEAVALAAVA